MGNARDGKIIEVLQADAVEHLAELLPGLIEQVENTRGEVPQSCTLTVKFKPGKESTSEAGEDKPAIFEVVGEVTHTNVSTDRTTTLHPGAKKGQQLELLVYV